MLKNKSRGYLPIECVNIILSIYKIQNNNRNNLLNEIEFIYKIKNNILLKKCNKCNINFHLYDDENIITFYKKNKNVFKIIYPKVNIKDIFIYNLLWNSRFECDKCGYLLCSNCRIFAEYPNIIDINMTYNNTKSIICPICKEIIELNYYISKLKKQLINKI